MGKFEKPKNPALNYVTKEEPIEEKVIKKEEVLEGAKIVYVEVKPETKSKRKALLMQPTVHDKILKMAKKKKLSFNDYVNEVLKEHIESNS